MKIKHLRTIVIIKKLLNSRATRLLSIIGASLFLIFTEAQKQTYFEKIEPIQFWSWMILLLLSIYLSSVWSTWLLRSKKEKKTGRKEIILDPNLIGIGFIAFIVLAIFSDFSVRIYYATVPGLIIGIGLGFLVFLKKKGLQVWQYFTRKMREKVFDDLANRPENKNRKSTKN